MCMIGADSVQDPVPITTVLKTNKKICCGV